MKKQVCFLLFLLAVGSCIDPLNVSNASTTVSMVVDGLITDRPGPYVVKLYESIKISDLLDTVHQIRGATLSISDDAGGSETLKEVSAGIYQTSTTTGAVGKTYTLHITLANGDTYESAPEKLLPVGDITNLKYEFYQGPPIAPHGDLGSDDGFFIKLDAQLVPEQEGRVRWRWNGTYEIQTYPQLMRKAVVDSSGRPNTVPDPPPCSGWAYYAQAMLGPDGIFYEMVFRKIGECTCCFCWSSEFNITPHTSDKVPENATTLSDVQIAFIKATNWHLYRKYVIEVEQLSCSPAVYNFWKAVEGQEQQSGDLFQTPPAATGGNISATSKNARPIVGIFSASGIKSKSLSLDSLDDPFAIEPVDSLLIECFRVFPPNTTVKPPFW